MFCPPCCSLCSNPLRCHCGTFDRRHESFCDLLTEICSDCHEAEADRIPDGPEPDLYADHVKELTLSELDALVREHATTTPWPPAPPRLLEPPAPTHRRPAHRSIAERRSA